jgi:hypothetical protein
MIDNKDNEIILCKGIKLDRNYENVLSYSESDMVTLCRNNAIYEALEYNFIEKANNRIVVSHPYSSAMYSNYVAFKNPRFGNKWIFAWVTDVKLINIGSTEITFEVDVWSTWYSRFNVGKAFIEREHVDDDTVGKHTIPEGLETGEYIAQIKNNSQIDPVINNMYYLSDVVIIAGVTTAGLGLAVFSNTHQNIYNGVYSGLYYLAFRTASDFSNYKLAVNDVGEISQDNIVTLYIAPNSLTGLSASDYNHYGSSQGLAFEFDMAVVPSSNYAIDMGDIMYPKADHLDNDYFPVNKKLLTFPYCFLNITNNLGVVKDYQYEFFNGSTCEFNIKGAIGVGCSIKMYPLDYSVKGVSSDTLGNKLHAIDGGKLPTCSWQNDAYTNWLTANSVNMALSFAQSTFTGVSTGGVAGGLVGGFGSITNSLASMYEHSLQPPTAKGGVNQGDLIFSERQTFNIYPMTIRKEYAIAIDSYLSRFGYKVNEVKTPNLNSRQQFNFIKVGGMDELIHGDIPSTDLEKINEICRKGVTIFHNYSNIGNYTISNPIVS